LSYTLGQKQLDKIEDILKQDLIDNGVRCVFLIDMAGNIIANLDNGEKQHDIYSLAALAANKITTEFLLITIFGNDISLGFLRLKVSESVEQLKIILEPLVSL
jgi:hypothetical protein